MAIIDPKEIAIQFNECINDGDIDGLGRLMSDEHTFIDTADTRIAGKQACLKAWMEFFRQFPDYENLFECVTAQNCVVTITGHSKCPDKRLEGPAIWTATIRDDKVLEWRVYNDTVDNRQKLDILD